jgi:hypothetical protein
MLTRPKSMLPFQIGRDRDFSLGLAAALDLPDFRLAMRMLAVHACVADRAELTCVAAKILRRSARANGVLILGCGLRVRQGSCSLGLTFTVVPLG